MTVIPHFNMGRVVQDYARGLYYPAVEQHARLMRAGAAGINAFASWKERVRDRWSGVRLQRLSELPRELPRAGTLSLTVAASLNGLAPEDVRVEFVAQRMLPRARQESAPLSSFRAAERPDDVWHAPLRATGETDAEGAFLYELRASPHDSGQFAFEIRIYPWHELLMQPLELGLLKRL
jgi:starch phosphorylase